MVAGLPACVLEDEPADDAAGGLPMMYVLIALTGILNAVQSGCNATLNKNLHHPFWAALVSFGTGLVALLIGLAVYSAVTRAPMPGAQQWHAIPWWAWMGGTLGAVYILAMVTTAEKAGSGVFMGLVVTASVVASLAIDHFGWLGFKQHTAGFWRLVGGALMLAGMFLIGRF